jgi:hypothetical protein
MANSLNEDESELVGSWVEIDGRMVGDAATGRIDRLIVQGLTKVGTASEGWELLYQDPRNGRYWELTYPLSYMHGGGPPTLRVLKNEVAQRKYGLNSSL